MAPGMAIMFLMFTVSYGGRSLLVENYNGTLPRLLVAPTTSANVLGGKAFGILLTAIAQLLILIGGTSLMFRLQWGDTIGVLVLILAAAWGATGWGILFAAILKTPGQIAITGSAVMLLFGVLGGSFFDLSMLPDWIQIINKITPNAWAIEGFRILSVGGDLTDIIPEITALLIMGAVLFTFATLWISKRGLARK
jgi:ABC-2 type transport system permease protein